MQTPISRFRYAAAALAGCALAPCTPLHGAVLAYDGFSAGLAAPAAGQYVSDPASTTGSNNDSLINQGPALTGFSGNWTGTTGDFAPTVYYRVNEGGLSYGSLQTTAGGLELFRSTGSNSSNKQLTRTMTFTGGDSVYFSLLLNTNYNHDIDLKLFPGSNSISFGTSTAGKAVVRYAGGLLASSTADFTLNTTHLLVVRVNDDDSFSLWLDPTDLSSEGANTAAATGTGTIYSTGSAFTKMDLISSASNGGNSTFFDEFRVGDTWADVLPVPEPSSAVLLLLGGAFLCKRGRGRAQKSR